MFPISIWQMILVAYCIGPVGRQAHASSKGLTAQSISAHWSGLRHRQRNGIFHGVSVPEGTHQSRSTRKYPNGLSTISITHHLCLKKTHQPSKAMKIDRISIEYLWISQKTYQPYLVSNGESWDPLLRCGLTQFATVQEGCHETQRQVLREGGNLASKICGRIVIDQNLWFIALQLHTYT